MKRLKVLATVILFVLSVSVLMLPSAAEGEASQLTELVAGVTVTPIVSENTDIEGWTVWTPDNAIGGTPEARGYYGNVNGENVFIVNRYTNSMKNPLITAKVKINDVEYRTIVDCTESTASGNSFVSPQMTTSALYFEDDVEIIAADKMFNSCGGLYVISVKTSYLKDLPLYSSNKWSYINENAAAITYTIKSDISSVYTANRVLVIGRNTAARTLTYMGKNNTQGKITFPAWSNILVDPQGGSIVIGENTYTAKYTEKSSAGNNYTYTTVPVLENYVFDGWDFSFGLVWNTTKFDQNLTLTAKWVLAPCSHTYEGEGTIIKAPNCTEAGIISYHCTKCNEEYTEEIPALGHNYVDCECVNCGDKKTVIATIGERKYESLQAAIDAAANEAVIVLESDVTGDTVGVVFNNKQLTVDLNGKTFSSSAYFMSNNFTVFNITSNSDVTIIDSVGGGKIIQTKSGRNNASAAYVNNATLHAKAGTYQGGGMYGGISTNCGNLYAENITVVGTYGNVMVIENDTENSVEMKNVTLNATNADGIWVESGKVNIKSGVYNGTVCAYGNTANIVISGGTFNDNVYIDKGQVSVSGGLYSNDITVYAADGYMAFINDNGKYELKTIETEIESVVEDVAESVVIPETKTTSQMTITKDAEENIKVEAVNNDITKTNTQVKLDEIVKKANVKQKAVVIAAPDAEVKFDAPAVQKIAAVVPNTTVLKLKIEKEVVNNVIEAIVDDTNKAVCDVSLVNQDDEKVEFNANQIGTATITMDYNGEISPEVFWVDGDSLSKSGISDIVFDDVNKKVTFKTTHFTVFVATSTAVVTWDYDTDAGYYDIEGDNPHKSGIMRFLFKASVSNATITETGIRYFKETDLASPVAVSAVGTASVFYGDIVNIPEHTTGNYYAIAYVVADGEYYFSNPLSCTPDFDRLIA